MTSKNIHDDRFSQADRIEIYKKVMTNPISIFASPEQYARVPLEGMPDPVGEVYRDDKEEVLTNVDYEKRPRYQVDREIDYKVEDFYKTESDYPTNFVYEQEDNQSQRDVTLIKQKKYRD